MKILENIRNFFGKKNKKESLEQKPTPFVQKIYDWVMDLDKDEILVTKSDYYNWDNTHITFVHISQKHNLTGDEGCGRRVTIKRVKETFTNKNTGNGFMDISYFLAGVGKWEEELNEEQLKSENVIEDNSGAIKSIFERAFQVHSEKMGETESQKEDTYISEIEKFMQNF